MTQLGAATTLSIADASDAERADVAKIARHDRPLLVAYANDVRTEQVLREGLSEAIDGKLDVRRAGIRKAIATLKSTVTPRILIADVGGEQDPLGLLSELAAVLEPDVQVLVIGDRVDVEFYRQVTRGLGSTEYLPKPLSRDIVLRHVVPVVTGTTSADAALHGGRFVAISGARGGTGITTIAAYLAWHLAVKARRHTALLDTDLQRGSAAMLLGVRVTGGLRTALETPARIDELFIERTAQILDNNPASDRLAVLAGEERLMEELGYAPGSAARLIDVMKRRYNFIIGDVPFQQARYHQDFMALAHQRVLVMDPTLAALRDMLRLLALPNGPMQTRRPIVVLNRAGIPGGLTRRQVEKGLKIPPDVVIDFQPRRLGQAATLGMPALAMKEGFRASILELARQALNEARLDVPATPDGERRRRADDPAPRRQRLFGRRK